MRRTNRVFLVTGASGFVGRALIDRLIGGGGTVHAVSRTGASPDPRATWARVDLTDRAATLELAAAIKPEVVFNLAGFVTGRREVSEVAPTLAANLVATVHLLEAMAETGCERFVQIASLEEPQQVEDPPSSPYAAAKGAATAYALMFARLFGVPAAVARLFMAYGPGPGPTTRLIPHVITSALAGTDIRLSSGRRPVDWIYLDDVAEGLIRISQTDEAVGRVVDLGSGDLVTVREVVLKLFDILGIETPPPFGSLPDRPFEQVRAANVAVTESLLGWVPQVGLDQGLAATVEWHRRQASLG